MASYNVTKYSRFWAVRDTTGELICICVYKRGALEVARRLSAVEQGGGYCLRETPPEVGLKQGPDVPAATRATE